MTVPPKLWRTISDLESPIGEAQAGVATLMYFTDGEGDVPAGHVIYLAVRLSEHLAEIHKAWVTMHELARASDAGDQAAPAAGAGAPSSYFGGEP